MAGKTKSPFAIHREGNKVQRKQKSHGFKGDSAGPGGSHPARRKKFYGTLRQKHSAEREQNAAGVEAPGQQHSRDEDGIKIEVDRGGRNETKRALENDAGGHQEQRSRQHQGLERFWGPEIHSRADPFSELRIVEVRAIISDAECARQ